MKKLSLLGLLFLIAFTVTGCQLYFGEEKTSGRDGICLDDGYYVGGEWVSAQCPGGGNACSTNKDCAAGCFCDITAGKCDEGGFCSDDQDCPVGYACDARSSCIPSGASCFGAISPTCTNGAPRCPQGSVPLIENGCYYDIDGDGQFDCSKVNQCKAPPTCDAYQYSADCAAASCRTITRGEDCRTSNNTACQDGQAGCICSRYVFSRCEGI
jgi:hypothetical protein